MLGSFGVLETLHAEVSDRFLLLSFSGEIHRKDSSGCKGESEKREMTRAKERIENKKMVSQQFSLQIYQIDLAEFQFSSKKHINQHCLHALSLHLLFYIWKPRGRPV